MTSAYGPDTRSVIAIVGPTASGKSAVADGLAERLHTAVISADSMQIYKHMNIGTAKMAPEDCHAPLLMVDVCDPDTPYSAALYQRSARTAIDSCLARGEHPIVCGGTGLYVRAALDVMEFPSGEAETPFRIQLQAFAKEHGSEALYARLQDVDPESASVIHPHNVRRVIRALEMAHEGSSYAKQKSAFSTPRAFYNARYFGLTMNRERLYERINQRVDDMFSQGLVEEVAALVEAGYKDALTSMQAIGYKEIIEALEGNLSMAEARNLIKMRSRRYAKRQLSWFRRDNRINWIDMDMHTTQTAISFVLDSLQ